MNIVRVVAHPRHQILGELASASLGAPHFRALVAAIGPVLEKHLNGHHLELTLPSASATTTVSWGEARSDERSATLQLPMVSSRCARLRVSYRSRLPDSWSREREAVEAVLGLACQACERVDRVAAVSRRAHHQNRELRRRLKKLSSDPAIVAESSSMRKVVERIELVAPHPATVLLRGESGTGKELLARYLHRCSTRASGPFVAVNCATLPPTLIESELFGHEKGAFTGADRLHQGRFERADGGTLFLDEIGELPAPVQASLLRVIQERSYERVGGTQSLDVDVRLVAATHRPLEAMIQEGNFREDLYYRLAVFPVRIPPLRERPQDIPRLVEVKLRQICERLGREVPMVSEELMGDLCAGEWRGNVRELENTLERSVILTASSRLELCESIPAYAAESSAPEALEEVVRGAIGNALKRSRGKIYGAGGAAEILGLKPSTLQAKMRKLGIERSFYARAGSE